MAIGIGATEAKAVAVSQRKPERKLVNSGESRPTIQGDRMVLSSQVQSKEYKDYDINESWKKRSLWDKLADRPLYHGFYYVIGTGYGAALGLGAAVALSMVLPATPALVGYGLIAGGALFGFYMSNTHQPMPRGSLLD